MKQLVDCSDGLPLYKACVWLLHNMIASHSHSTCHMHGLFTHTGRKFEDLLILCVTFLKKLCTVGENKDAINELNVMDLLIKFVPCSSQPLITITLRLLFNLSFDKVCLCLLACLSVLRLLLNCTLSGYPLCQCQRLRLAMCVAMLTVHTCCTMNSLSLPYNNTHTAGSEGADAERRDGAQAGHSAEDTCLQVFTNCVRARVCPFSCGATGVIVRASTTTSHLTRAYLCFHFMLWFCCLFISNALCRAKTLKLLYHLSVDDRCKSMITYTEGLCDHVFAVCGLEHDSLYVNAQNCTQLSIA